MKKVICRVVSILMIAITVLAIIAAATATGSGFLDLSNIGRGVLIGIACTTGIIAGVTGGIGWKK